MLSTLFSIAASATIALAASSGLDTDLHRSFYGIAYTPTGVILPDCGATQTNVTKDIELLAQLTPRIRLYGADCNQTALVLQAIQDTNADLSVWLGIYIDGNDTVYDRQMKYIEDAISTYGADHIAGITVGNEYILDAYGSSGSATDANGVKARTTLLSYITKTNETIIALGLDKTIPIGTSDAGAAATETLCAGTDYFMGNIHAWFGSVGIDQAAGWVWNFFQEFDVSVCAEASNNATVYVAETGWPTASDDTANEKNGANAYANIANLQIFLDDYVCQANKNGTGYFFFELMDEDWKAAAYGGVEGHWGLFDDNYNLKDGLTIPNCEVTSPTGGTVSQLIVGSGSSSSSSNSTSSASSNSTSTSDSAAFPRVPSTPSTGFGGVALGVGALLVGGMLI